MSMRIKLNVKNVILGYHNFSDILATHDSQILSCFSRLFAPRVISLCRPDCDYYKLASVRRSTLNNAEGLLPRKLENLSLKWVSSEKPVSKWLDEVQTGSICTPGSGLPWESSYSFCYDQKNPKCPVKPKYLPYPPCPPMLKYNRYKEPIKFDSFAESIPCALKTVPLNICRFYSANPFQPRRRRRKAKACKCNPCGPKQVQCKPVPKCCPKKKELERNSWTQKPKSCSSGPRGGGKKQSCPQPPKVQCPKPKC